MILIIEMQSEKTCFAFLEKQQRLWLKGERIMPEEKEKERKVIKVTLDELNNVSGGDGKEGSGGGHAAERHRPARCYMCGSENLEFLGSEYVEARKTTVKHYRCKDCGFQW